MLTAAAMSEPEANERGSSLIGRKKLSDPEKNTFFFFLFKNSSKNTLIYDRKLPFHRPSIVVADLDSWLWATKLLWPWLIFGLGREKLEKKKNCYILFNS